MTPIVLPESGMDGTVEIPSSVGEASGDVGVSSSEPPDPEPLPEGDPVAAMDMDDPDYPDEVEPGPDLMPLTGPEETATGETTPLLDLKTAIQQIPEELRKEMEDLLRADFREVIRWTPPKT